MGLAGWVRNRRNGTVEAVIAGDDKAIEAMLNAMWSGPTVAQVTAVDIEAWTAEISDGFSVWPTV